MPKTVLLDYYGVLDNHLAGLLKLLADTTFSDNLNIPFEKHLIQTYGKYGLLIQLYFDGSILADHFWQKLNDDGLDESIIQALQTYMLKPDLNQAFLLQLEKLKDKIKFKVLVTCPTDRTNLIKDFLNSKTYFQNIYFSNEVNLNPKSIEFINKALENDEEKPSEVLYISTDGNSLEIAKKAGFEVVAYNNEINLVKYFN